MSLLQRIRDLLNPPKPVEMDTMESIVVDRRTRSYLAHLPAGGLALQTPLVLNFHGGLGNANQHRDMTRMNAIADKYGFIVVYPNGTGLNSTNLTWNAGSCCGYAKNQNIDDIGFVSQLIDKLRSDYPVNDKRIYACGFSNGAMLCHLLGLDLPHKIAAIGTVSGTYPLGETFPTTPIPVIHLHGIRDRNSLFFGGVGSDQLQTSPHRSVMDSMDCWVSANVSKTTPAVQSETNDWMRLDFESGVRALQLHVYPNGGHVWPADASELLCDFFSRHQLEAA